jgi:uncharacterized membrane protein YdjX (TVP38/TMEM64 family)
MIMLATSLLALIAVARIATLGDADASTDVLESVRTWAWAVGIVLIVADLVLPVPQTSVLAALGAIYGLALATLIGTIALVLAGVMAYLLMLTPVGRFMMRLLRGRSREMIDALSNRSGPLAIALSRGLPYSVPEAIVCLAGLARMPVKTFLISLASGSAPTALLYAGIGAGWARDPLLALAISYVLPILLLPGVLFVMDRRDPVAVDPATGSPTNSVTTRCCTRSHCASSMRSALPILRQCWTSGADGGRRRWPQVASSEWRWRAEPSDSTFRRPSSSPGRREYMGRNSDGSSRTA